MGKKRKDDAVIRYPWDRWFARKHPFPLRRGWEFLCQTHSMAVQVRNAAAARNKRVSIKIVGENLHVTIVKKKRRKN